METERIQPSLRMALLCDQAIEGKDGALTIVRVVDRFEVVVQVIKQPSHRPKGPLLPPVFSGSFVAGFIGGRGDFKCQVKLVSPSGKVAAFPELPFRLDMPEKGQNLIFGLRLPFEEAGLYQFQLLLDGELIAEHPMRVIIQQIEVEPPPFPKN